jgi:hypothetical protein
LGNLEKTDLDKLAKLLSSENNGKVKYLPFLIFLRTLSSSTHDNTGKNYENFGISHRSNNNCKIIEQLIENCVDTNGTLLQLRKYLIQNLKNNKFTSDKNDDNNNDENRNEVCEITIPELVKLFKHFGVLFNFHNFCQFITNIGFFPSTKKRNDRNYTETSSLNRYNDTYMGSRGIRKNALNDFENANNTEFSKFENKSIDGRILMKKIIEVSKFFIFRMILFTFDSCSCQHYYH